MQQPLLEIRDLEVDILINGTPRPLVKGVSHYIFKGEALGLVGESGSGKSLTARAIIRLLPSTAIVRGHITYDGSSVSDMSAKELQRFRSHQVSMVFQDPRAHINPVRTVGDFLTDGLRHTHKMSNKDSQARCIKLLKEVGIVEAERRMAQLPHELSGGLLQRVMIASALSTEPQLLLADEPTTALDVTTQEEVVAILDELRRERGLAMLFITHDLDLAAAVCDRVSVMLQGRVVENLPAQGIYSQASHPYTVALLAARPSFHIKRPLPESEPPPVAPNLSSTARKQ
jgi:ABC-type dipeptide/oligopeptide/nickel transport system ATPase component